MASRVVAVLALALFATAAPPPQAPPEVRIEKNVPAPMRDGVILRADVYRPAMPGRLPVLLQRT
ncbi:MAG: X-Pro dipeptidyl-peptidase, partial [Acidobacteria bacterium]|nr:X-Pro dipeptidyl-peptidase [Acidobacteriota bacterium]